MVEEQRWNADRASNERKPRFARGTQELDPIRCEPPGEAPRVDDPIAEIVHDLKSPLSAISLEATLLGERMRRGGGDRSNGMRSIERIHQNVEYLDRLILDLLDASCAASGALALCLEPTELRRLIEGALHRIVTPQDHHRVRLDAPCARTLVIDALRIERVVSNLIDNALKYTPVTGRIFVRLRFARGVARVSVIDEGPGLRAAEAACVFDQYSRASTARGRSGCGLGLYVSKKIVEAHGGKIGVDSIRGVGSRFYFELPAS